MRWLSFVASSLVLSACASQSVQSKRLEDGSLSITCDLPMAQCVQAVQDQCPNQRFRILEGVSETRLRDVPPYESQFHTSRLHLVCSNDGADALLSLDAPKAAPSAAPAAATAPACSRGETRECVGPGACKGGQACLPDGSGFGECDCGPVVPAPSASEQPAVAPSGSAPSAEPPTAPVAPTPAP